MNRFLIALQFLTVLPIKIKPEIKNEDFGKSLVYFPIVGTLMGFMLVLSAYLFNFLPSMVMAALILIISNIITGGIHLDGFADTCDGFYGGKSKEEVLRIMRDSRIGAMGIIGVASILLLKFALFCSIPFNVLWKALIVMALWGRFSQVLSCTLSNYARENSKAKSFIEYATQKELIISAIFTFMLSILLMKLAGIILFIVLVIISLLLIAYIKHRIGGMTGDTIGAISETTEVIALFFVLICLRIPWF